MKRHALKRGRVKGSGCRIIALSPTLDPKLPKPYIIQRKPSIPLMVMVTKWTTKATHAASGAAEVLSLQTEKGLGAEYLSPKKANLLNYIRFI